MAMKFIAREIMPQELEILGTKYPALYSYKAIAIMEEHTQMPHTFTEVRMKGKNPNLTANEILGLTLGLLQAAGVEVDYETLENSLSPHDAHDLVPQLVKIVNEQSDAPEEEDKNSKKSKN